MTKLIGAIAIFVLVGMSSGCAHYHLRARSDPSTSSYFKKTLNTPDRSRPAGFIVPPTATITPGNLPPGSPPSAADCKDNGLHEVGITSSWAYAAGTVFSFGRWSRVKVEWKCAKEPPVIGPSGFRPLSPAPVASGQSSTSGVQAKPQPAKTDKDGFIGRTMHAFLWGAVQQNLVQPDPSRAFKSPANCKSLLQVRLPTNYAFAFVTFITAGLWSPMRVKWKCNDESKVALDLQVPASRREITSFSQPLSTWRPLPITSPR